MSVIWHDIECGAYGADIALWRSLAREHPGPVLDVGAGTGQDHARPRPARATAWSRSIATPSCSPSSSRRGAGLEVETVVADAREFSTGGSGSG